MCPFDSLKVVVSRPGWSRVVPMISLFYLLKKMPFWWILHCHLTLNLNLTKAFFSACAILFTSPWRLIFLKASLLIFKGLTKICILLDLVLDLRILILTQNTLCPIKLRVIRIETCTICLNYHLSEFTKACPITFMKEPSGFRQLHFHFTCYCHHVFTLCPQIGFFPMNQHLCQTNFKHAITFT